MNLCWEQDSCTIFVNPGLEREKVEPVNSEEVIVALDIPEPSKILCVYQHKEWWTRPSFPESLSGIPRRTQLLLLKYDEYYTAFLAITGEVSRTDLEGHDGRLYLRISTNTAFTEDREIPVMTGARGLNPYECIARAAETAVNLIGHPEILRRCKRYPEIFKGFGWCSWNAFYQDVSEKQILQKLEELRRKQIPVRWVLIDDGWSEADYRSKKLRGFDADRKKFPNGLGGVVRAIKEKYGIPYVGVWHATMGYWEGIEEHSEVFEEVCRDLRKLPDDRYVIEAGREKAFDFYDAWHGYLRADCGVDFVKVDGQSSISVFYRNMKSYGEASNEIQKGLNASAALHFDNTIINCMGMAPEDVWHRESSMITRTSDDFVPDVKHGFREHAIQNAYSSLWARLFYTGDWDMFFSEHAESRQNGILRAISGGPVYVSDKAGASSREEIMKLLHADGSVLKCDDVGVPTEDCLFQDPVKGDKALKIYNRICGKGRRGEDIWYIAAFNIRTDEKETGLTVSVTDIPELKGKDWILYDESKQLAFSLSEKAPYSRVLQPNEAVMLEILPTSDLSLAGVDGKYLMSGCVEQLDLSGESTESVYKVLDEGKIVIISDRNKRPYVTDMSGRKQELIERKQEAETGKFRVYTTDAVQAGTLIRVSVDSKVQCSYSGRGESV